jgi:hypothetical protein
VGILLVVFLLADDLIAIRFSGAGKQIFTSIFAALTGPSEVHLLAV